MKKQESGKQSRPQARKIVKAQAKPKRKSESEILRESEKRFRALMEQASDGIFISDSWGRYTDVNTSGCEMLGYTREEILNMGMNDLLSDEDARNAPPRLDELLAGKHILSERRLKRKDGTLLSVEVSAKMLSDGRLQGIVRDITERKQAENALRASEEKHRTVLENVDEIIYQLKGDDPFRNTIEFVSPHTMDILGYTPDEFMQDPVLWSRLLHPDDLPAVQKQTLAILSSNQPGTREYRMMHKTSGEYRWMEDRITPQLNEAGQIVGIFGLARDITERKRADEERSQLLKMLESSLNEIYVFDAETLRFHYVSNGALRNLGYSPAFIQTMTPVDIKPEFNEVSFRNLLEPLRNQEKEQLIFQTVHRRADASLYPVEVHLQLIEQHGKKVFLAINPDTTESKQAEATLKKLSSAVEQTADNVIITDRDGSIQYVNPAFERFTGYTKEEITGSTPRVVKSGEHKPQFFENLWETILGGKVFRAEFINRKKNGELYYEEKTISPLRDDQGNITHFISTGRDITERKHAEEKIRRQMENLSALRKIDLAITSNFDLKVTLNTIIEGVVHQLRVDAAAILLFKPALNELELTAGVGFRNNIKTYPRLKLGEGLAGRVVVERRPLFELDLNNKAETVFSKARLPIEEGFVALYAMPLIVKGKVKGVLEVLHRSKLNPNSEWLDFLQSLAGQSAIAIDNAELFGDLQRSNLELRLAYDATIEGWSRALDLRDKETEGHTQRVTEKTLKLASRMGMSDADLVHVRRGALLHDMGKLGVPDHILLKPGPLTDDEWVLMRKHPKYAYDMLAPIAFLRRALEIPAYHHEKWDGSGYPNGMEGEAIPLAARIFSVVDIWDAIRSDRPYRPAWTKEKALDHIKSLSGSHLDPKVVAAFLEMIHADE